MGSEHDVTRLLGELGSISGRAQVDEVLPLVYEELRRLAEARLRGERPDHTLNATALVHEAYVKLVDQRRTDWKNRAHFFAIAARAMRRILVDHANKRNAAKRGGGAPLVTLVDGETPRDTGAEQLIELDEALHALEAVDGRQAQVVQLRFFAGLGHEEIAEALGVSVATVNRDWRSARAWLTAHLQG